MLSNQNQKYVITSKYFAENISVNLLHVYDKETFVFVAF